MSSHAAFHDTFVSERVCGSSRLRCTAALTTNQELGSSALRARVWNVCVARLTRILCTLFVPIDQPAADRMARISTGESGVENPGARRSARRDSRCIGAEDSLGNEVDSTTHNLKHVRAGHCCSAGVAEWFVLACVPQTGSLSDPQRSPRHDLLRVPVLCAG
jgi:hypothetical protein